MTLRVMVAGEGPNELGAWGQDPAYRDTSNDQQGVLEALARNIRPDGWEIVAGRRWKDIRKFRAGEHRSNEARNVMGLLLEAWEARAKIDAVLFLRDQDGDVARISQVEAALADAARQFPESPPVAGGVMVRKLESWIVAAAGHTRSEEMGEGQLEQALSARGVRAKDTGALVSVIREATLSQLPNDAKSLRTWLERVRQVLLTPRTPPPR